MYVQRRVGIVVERADADVFGSLRFQLNLATDHVDDIDSGEQFGGVDFIVHG